MTCRRICGSYNPLISFIRNSRLPVVAAVNGVAAGAGASLAFACDIVIAAAPGDAIAPERFPERASRSTRSSGKRLAANRRTPPMSRSTLR
ncbi:enoyl-CoA hydratase-related protein [Mesorhizobium sp. L-8-10]|uniref:enoyl-CoA hydratase-related protein n=1 Tax=Mesorhizobium sp. L-8-10 TaxID=2744523 RepID=UPI00406C7EA5